MIDEKKLIDEIKSLGSTDDPMLLETSILSLINDQPKVGEWIPVSERLPEKKGEYLFTTNSYSGVTIEIYIFDPENNWDVEFAKTGMDLMAWMPLPEAYREESAE